ncbi:sugar ABC transporter substrate-binding protein [Marinicrinis sediminis]|uniref:Extracellular solute-binding protein n=1 Tax=Marinicrinis sediminis TaxID=1652465 RepID=A0ABW5RFS3_9BACL
MFTKKMMWSGLIILCMLFTVTACNSGNNNENSSGNNPSSSQANASGEADNGNAGSEAVKELEPEPDAKLLVWDGKDGLPFLQEIAKSFTEETGIPVEVQEQGAPEQIEKMRTDGPAGSAADIITLPHNDLGNAVSSGFVLPNDFYEEETRSEFIEAAVKAVTFDGMLYGYPRNMETYALFVNNDLVKGAPLETWEDVIQFSKSFNDVENNRYGFMMRLESLYFTYPFLTGYGGYIFGEDGTDPTDIGLNHEGSVKGLEVYKSLKEILPMAVSDASDDVKTALFEEGKLAINLDGVWNIGNFSNLDADISMIPLPKFDNGNPSVSFAGVKAYYVSAYSQYPKAARLFAHYVTTQEALLKNYEITGFIPARKGMAELDAIKADKMVVGALKQLEHSHPMPSIVEMGQVWTPFGNALQLIWDGADIKPALDKAVEDLKVGIDAQNNE